MAHDDLAEQLSVKLPAGIIVTALLAACTDNSKSSSTVDVPKTLASTDAWRGQWNGPEGTFLRIEGENGIYTVTIQNLDGPQTYPGSSTGSQIRFERYGVKEIILATSGAQTGMKWLADKSSCLTIRSGEGYCRDEKSLATDAPPVPYEDVGACPFEGCVYREWLASAAVEIHAERRNDSPVVAQVAQGEKVQALGGVVVTIKAGRVQFDKPQKLSADSGPIEILPGQTLYLLTYLGEGNSKAWFNGRLYEWVDISNVTRASGWCGYSDAGRCTGVEAEGLQSEWWVQVKTASGKVGWTLETRKFDNKDLFG